MIEDVNSGMYIDTDGTFGHPLFQNYCYAEVLGEVFQVTQDEVGPDLLRNLGTGLYLDARRLQLERRRAPGPVVRQRPAAPAVLA